MPLTLTTWNQLALRVGSEARLTQYAGGDDGPTHPNTDAAIVQASDMFRSAAVNRYTEASVDALTYTTVTPEVRHHIESIVLGILTSGDDVQPETIQRAQERAYSWLSWLIGGTVNIDGLDPIGSAVASGGGVRYRGRTRIVGSDEYNARVEKL